MPLIRPGQHEYSTFPFLFTAQWCRIISIQKREYLFRSNAASLLESGHRLRETSLTKLVKCSLGLACAFPGCIPLKSSGGHKTVVNRKLIRPSLADMKVKGRELDQPKARVISGGGRPMGPSGGRPPSRPHKPSLPSAPPVQVKKRQPPPQETNAELYYYKKQIDAHTQMVIVLHDDEEIEGTIEWYDKAALKVNRKDAPNILLLKHNIKYMYKLEDRDGGGDDTDDDDGGDDGVDHDEDDE